VERIASEASPESLDELSATTPLDDLPTPTRPATQGGREKTVASRPGRVQTEAAPRPSAQRPVLGYALAVVAALALAGGVAWVTHARAGAEPASPQPVQAAPAATAQPAKPPAPTPLAAPLPVLVPPTSITVATEPAGAEVVIDGKPRGRTPLTLEVSKDAPLSASFRLPGYLPITTTLTADQAPRRTVTLERKPPVHHASPLRIKTGR
jgi:hypothetical protein